MQEKLKVEIDAELQRASEKYGERFNSINEALGTIYGEFCELRNDIISHSFPELIRAEAIQVAAMAIKLVQYIDERNKQ